LRPRGARRSDGEEEREGSGHVERVRALWEMNARVTAAPGEVFDHGLVEIIEEDTARRRAPPARSSSPPRMRAGLTD
jgi:hypothetical protein